jgi:thiol-disulfide isomerase/thioredoxin
VAFGASNCPKCREDIPQISVLYPKWKAQGVEVVFISLDTDTQEFSKFATSFPFLSTCDFKGWKSPLVESYYVFGTPTLFLLDKKREILLRPLSVKQVDAWVDWVLIQGNK